MIKWYKKIEEKDDRAFLVRLEVRLEFSAMKLYWEDRTVRTAGWSTTDKSCFNYYTQFLAEAYKQIEETEAVALLL